MLDILQIKCQLISFYLPFIIKAFPNSKIIHIRRNKLDNCFSIYERKFQGQMPWAYDWKELLEYYDLL